MNRLIQRNAEAYEMSDGDAHNLLSELLAEIIKRIDYVNPDAFTTISDFCVGFMEDLIKKGKMFNQKADSLLPGISNKCFDNCMEMSNSRLKMYMGFALTDNEQAAIEHGCTDIPEEMKFCGWVIHCWLVDKKTGKVIETSPKNGILAYFGFQVNVDYIHNWVRALKQYPLTPTPTKKSVGHYMITVKNSDILATASGG